MSELKIRLQPQSWPDWVSISEEDATTDGRLPNEFLDINVSMMPPDTYEALYEKYWATGKENFHKLFVVRQVLVPPLSPPKTLNPQHYTSVTARFMHLSPSLRHGGLYDMLILEEYDFLAGEILRRFKAQPPDVTTGGVILLGHPGIGKSTFLRYFAIRMILAGLDIYVLYGEFIYCFTSEAGNFHVPANVDGWREIERKKVWPTILLVDHQGGTELPAFLQDPGHSFWICLASSPTKVNYRPIAKYRELDPLWVQPNNWEEVFIVCHELRNGEHCIAEWREMFQNYSPTLRECAAIPKAGTESAAKYQFLREGVLGAVESLDSETLQLAVSAIKRPDPSAGGVSFPSKLFIPISHGDTRSKCAVDCVTSWVAEQLVIAEEVAEEQTANAFQKLFSWSSSTAASGENLYEARYIRFINRHVGKAVGSAPYKLLLRRLKQSDTQPGDDPATSDTDTLEIPTNAEIIHFHRSDPSELFERLRKSRESDDVIIIPTSRIQATWDLCCYIGGKITMIQVTTSPSHSFLVSGVDTIRDHITPALPVPPGPPPAWSMIFVVPPRLESSWDCAIPITHGKAATNTIEKRPLSPRNEYSGIRQYVATWS